MAAEDGTGAALFAVLIERVRDAAAFDDLIGPDLEADEVRSRLAPLAGTDAVVIWTGVNASRFDAVVADGVDEWRVVFGTDDDARIDWLFVYRRPPLFAGVPSGCAVVVNGPSGAGKSTVLAGLRQVAAGTPWVLFDEPENVGSVDPEFLIWRDRAPALHEGYLAAVGAMARAGNLVAVAAGGRPQAEFRRHLLGTPTVWVGLYCDREVLVARERGRTGRWGGLVEASIAAHDGWDYDLVFDTTDSPDPSTLARAVLDATGRARTRSP